MENVYQHRVVFSPLRPYQLAFIKVYRKTPAPDRAETISVLSVCVCVCVQLIVDVEAAFHATFRVVWLNVINISKTLENLIFSLCVFCFSELMIFLFVSFQVSLVLKMCL